MFDKVLIANRGEIAVPHHPHAAPARASRSVAVYSEADAHAPHVRDADEAVRIGPPPAAESYLTRTASLEAAREDRRARRSIRATASCRENAEFAAACEAAGHRLHRADAGADARLRPASTQRARLAARSGVPLLARHGPARDVDEALAAAERDRLSRDAQEHGRRRRHRHARLRRRGELCAKASSGAAPGVGATSATRGVFLESSSRARATSRCRSSATARARCVALGERDCSVQRRNQKVIEETPAPGCRRRRAALLRRGACASAARSATVGRDGRVRLRRRTRGEFYFLEVNTRLQVEHRVTEDVTGVDLVEWMMRAGRGRARPAARSAPRPAGTRSRCASTRRTRRRTSSPSAGMLTAVALPADARVRQLDRDRQRGHAATTIRAREDHRARRRPRRRASRDCATRSTPRASTASRRTSTSCARSSRDAVFARGARHDAYARDAFALRAADDRGARAPARRRRCRTGRAGSAMGGRRAAVGSDGRPRVSAREPPRRQRRRRGRRSRSR